MDIAAERSPSRSDNFRALGTLAPSLAQARADRWAIGVLTLGMMTRVDLGHTGRMLAVPRSLAVAFLLVIAGALLRVSGAWPAPPAYVPMVTAAGLLWSAGFAIYPVVHAPLLVSPRIDGRPG
jgi:uncharacterized protein involved in response to NO